MFHLILCLAITYMSSIGAADNTENTLPREVAFGEQLIQKYLTAREASSLLLVSKFHYKQVVAYRDERIKQFESDKDKDESFKKLNIIPSSVVIDVSGNSAYGISNSSVLLGGLDNKFYNGALFRIHPKYLLIDKARPELTGSSLSFAHTTYNRILGLCFVFNSCYTSVVIYLPSGSLKVWSLDVDKNIGRYSYNTTASTITISKRICYTQASYRNNNTALVNTEKFIPIFSVSIQGLAQAEDSYLREKALEELHDYSTS